MVMTTLSATAAAVGPAAVPVPLSMGAPKVMPELTHRPGTFEVEVDELLLARARRGENAAIEHIFHTFERPVFNLARRLCRTQHDAEDVMQETFFEVFRSLPRFRGDGSFAGWVRRVAASKALQKLRKAKSAAWETELDEDAIDQLPSPHGEHGAPTSARIDLETALARLGDTARVVVWLHEVEGWTHDEIAALCGKSASFSKSHLSRAHARLRAWLGAQGRDT